jgi:hypothetical protein
MDPLTFRKWWTTEGNQDRYRLQDGKLIMDGEASPAMVRTAQALTSYRRDEYASDPHGTLKREEEIPVGDLRLDLNLELKSKSGTIVLEIRDGTQGAKTFRLELSPTGSDTRSQLKWGDADVTPDKLASYRLPVNEEVVIQFENCDDKVRVLVDDEEIGSYLYVQGPTETPWGGPPSSVGFGITKGTAEVHYARVYRDLYYTPFHQTSLEYQVPEDCFLFFGDNSPSSLDARGWRVSGIRIRESNEVILGDLEAVSDDFSWPRRRSNPFFETEVGDSKTPGSVGAIKDEQVHVFLDLNGNSWRLEPGSYDLLDLNAFDMPGIEILDLHLSKLENPTEAQVAAKSVSTAFLKEMWSLAPGSALNPMREAGRLMHYVHRRDIMGQANFIFWPLSRCGVIR